MATLVFRVTPVRVEDADVPDLDAVLVAFTSTADVLMFPLASGAFVPFYLPSDAAAAEPFTPNVVAVTILNAELAVALPLSSAQTLSSTQSLRDRFSSLSVDPALDGNDILSATFAV
jgi:hypothetical protein